MKEVEIELKSSIDNFFNELCNTDNQFDSSLSDNSSNENMSDNENPVSSLKKIEPRPPTAPIPEDSRRHRRRHHRISEQTSELSQHGLQSANTMDNSSSQTKNRRKHQQQENETDNIQTDPYGSTHSLRRSGIFQTLKLKADKIRLPRPSSARGGDPDDEKQQKKNRKSASGALRPARVSDSTVTKIDEFFLYEVSNAYFLYREKSKSLLLFLVETIF